MQTSIFLLFSAFLVYANADVYWRSLEATIPIDAYPLEDSDNPAGPVYLGQIYTTSGTSVGPIYNGNTTIHTAYSASTSYSSDLKILCTSNKTSLSWLPTNSTTFSTDTSGLRPVIAGSSSSGIKLYIGRAAYGPGHIDNNYKLTVPYSSTTYTYSVYDVLIVDKN